MCWSHWAPSGRHWCPAGRRKGSGWIGPCSWSTGSARCPPSDCQTRSSWSPACHSAARRSPGPVSSKSRLDVYKSTFDICVPFSRRNFSKSYTVSPFYLKVVLIKQYQPQEGPWHGPLVSTVLEHYDVQDSLQHLLEDLWPHLDHGHQRVVVGVCLSRAARLLA